MSDADWAHFHVHSENSTLDGMSKVGDLVAKAARIGQPAIALTDHGNMSGVVQLYKAAKQHSILPYPGVEAYLVPEHGGVWDSKAPRYHIGFLALTFRGYQALIRMVSNSYTRPQFSRFPRIDMDDLAILSNNAQGEVAILTGCYFGYVQQSIVAQDYVDPGDILDIYSSLFPDTTYVEIQNHYIDTHEDGFTDSKLADILYGLAQEKGLPIIITQDSHYLNVRDSVSHALMKRMVYGGAEDEFPGDSFHLASTRFVKSHHEQKHWDEALLGSADLLSKHKLVLPALEKFKAHIPSVVSNPLELVSRVCRKKLASLLTAGKLGGKEQVYKDRLDHELDVIQYLEIAGYFTLVRKIIQWCNNNDVFVEARGSANGSLVCYLLGITQVDPIEWGTLFERFLSRDRTKPPDIDLDVEDTKRVELLSYISQNFPTQQIGTFAKLGENSEGRGSVLVTYLAGQRKILGDQFTILGYNKIKVIEDIKDINEEDYIAIKRLANMEVRKSYGVHAAGLLISADSQTIEEYVPMMLVASSDTRVTQFSGDDIEDLGYCKIDVLGQRTLAMMRRCQEFMGRSKPTDFTWIPYDDPKTMKSLWEGRTDTGVFHFEGYTKSKGARQMKPVSTLDLCLAQGLFMPGAMESGETEKYLERRSRSTTRNRITYIHPAFEKALDWTYGCVIFQEQVIEIMRNLGMGIEAINIFFKVVKDSGSGSARRNEARLSQVRAEFESVCRRNKIRDVDAAWASTAGFVAYGFNRAHATGYGIRAYRCAYLKTHYPLQFMAALLESVAGKSDFEVRYTTEARRIGLRIMPPDINVSGAVWTIDTSLNAIRKGLSSVKGVGVKAATQIMENAPYKDLDDFIARTDSRAVTGGKHWPDKHDPRLLTGVVKALQLAGALESIGVGRFD